MSDPTEIRDLPCSVCERFFPEDELSIDDNLCIDCVEEKIYCECDKPYPYYDICGECGYHLKNIN